MLSAASALDHLTADLNANYGSNVTFAAAGTANHPPSESPIRATK